MDHYGVELRVLKEKLEKLKKTNQSLVDENRTLRDENERFRQSHDYYMLIQNACKNSAVVADEFSRFLLTCRLTEEEGVPGLTEEEDPSQLRLDYGR